MYKIITQLFYVLLYEGMCDVNSVLIDASKVFDSMHWGELFSTLIEKKVSYIFIRLLFDSYVRQKA